MLPEFSGLPVRVVGDQQIALEACVMAIGAFDGVHRGHQGLISAAVAEARARHVPAVVWTFDPPPKVFFGRAVQLTPLHQKIARIARLGVDWIVVASFTRSYTGRSAESFMDDLARLNPQRIHVGEDFRFGAGQSGDAGQLAERFTLTLARPVCCARGETISSSRIRALIADGVTDDAARLLAAPDPLTALGGALQTIDIRLWEENNA